MVMQQQNRGAILAASAYSLWGLAPIYFKLVREVPALEILCHRMVWSFLFMLLLLTIGRHWAQVVNIWRDRKKLVLLMVTATIVSGNWLLYIWAINHNHMLEASLGYFINPLVNILLGTLFLRERLRPMQWCAVALAFSGVALQLWGFGSVPVVGLSLAFSFGAYALIRKKIVVDAQGGMMIETLWMLPLAAFYLFFIAQSPTSNMLHNPLSLNLLLIFAGILTMVPLLLFTAAANALRLSTLGFFQYIAPTIVFLLAIFVYGEPLEQNKLITFAFIWIALMLFTLDALYTQRKIRGAVIIAKR